MAHPVQSTVKTVRVAGQRVLWSRHQSRCKAVFVSWCLTVVISSGGSLLSPLHDVLSHAQQPFRSLDIQKKLL